MGGVVLLVFIIIGFILFIVGLIMKVGQGKSGGDNYDVDPATVLIWSGIGLTLFFITCNNLFYSLL